MQQTTYQTNTYKKQKTTCTTRLGNRQRQIHWMPFWTTFKKIHVYTQTRLFITKGITIKIHRVRNNSQGSSQEETEEISYSTRVDNDNINEGENFVKTRYGRVVRKPDRLMYQ